MQRDGGKRFASGVRRAAGLAGLSLALAAWAVNSRADETADLGFRVPDGFEVTRFADDDLATNLSSLTIDGRGRVVVSGPGFVKILPDDDGDGRADRAILLSDLPKSGAHGLLFDGDGWLATGDNGLWRFTDRDGDDRADGPGERWATLKHSEHGANGLVRGPDGAIYLICGNDAGVDVKLVRRLGSPVAQPGAGAVVRFSLDGRTSDVVAHGFRNPYDLDFDAEGHLFTVDSDNERDHALPWYAPTRLFDIAAGTEHGWLMSGFQRSWNRPPWMPDSGPRVVEIGRGSPTGLVVYRHRQFPAAYRGGVFSACWTFGRVYHLPLARAGASVESRRTVFLETTGDVGFAPCDLAVGPEGDLFVAIGGRGTRGGVFRVRYRGGVPLAPIAGSELDRVLRADQPLTSWSRADWVPRAKKLGREPFAAAVLDRERSEADRLRAVEVLTELFGGVRDDEAVASRYETAGPVFARVVWSLGRGEPGESGLRTIVAATSFSDARTQRAAWEAVAMQAHRLPAAVAARADFKRGFAHADRRVVGATLAAARSLARYGNAGWRAALHPSTAPDDATVLAGRWAGPLPVPPLDVLGNPEYSVDQQLLAVRMLQWALGDLRTRADVVEVYTGYAAHEPDRVPQAERRRWAARLSAVLPSAPRPLDLEVLRTLSMLGEPAPAAVETLAARWTDDSPVLDDLHGLIAASRLPGPRTSQTTERTAAALLRVHAKLERERLAPDRNWPLRVAEVVDALLEHDPALAAALARHPALGRADHALFVGRLPEVERLIAARRLVEALARDEAAADDEDAGGWTVEVVAAVDLLPDAELLPLLRARWNSIRLRDAILPRLARRPAVEDRARYVEALDALDGEVVLAAAGALRAIDVSLGPAELAAVLASLRRACAAPELRRQREALVALLKRSTGQAFDVREPKGADLIAAYRPWFDWFAEAHPAEAARLGGATGVDLAAWRERLTRVDWTRGDAGRGRLVFERRSCHRCHTGAGKLGPDLAGAAGRFSRADLFTSILDPSKDVAPLYQTTTIVTHGGQVYVGIPIYDSAEGLILQVTPDKSVRVVGSDVAVRAPSRQSLMPTGLLNEATDQDLADLDAFLRTLTKGT